MRASGKADEMMGGSVEIKSCSNSRVVDGESWKRLHWLQFYAIGPAIVSTTTLSIMSKSAKQRSQWRSISAIPSPTMSPVG